MKKPLVSIIIPVYNGEKYLEDAITSALSQTYKNIEVIVVDDGSTDNTRNIALKYGNKVRYIKKENGGVSSALNTGIKCMKGDYFSWLSHDDLYLSTKIETNMEYISKFDNVTILYSNFKLLYDFTNKLKSNNNKESHQNKYDPLLNISLSGITFLIPKSCFKAVGFFNEKLRYTQDYDMWFRLLKKYNFYYIDEPLAITRIHELQESNLKNVIPEGNNFWISTIKDIINMKAYDKEELLTKMAIKLSSPYTMASNYCLLELKSINNELYKKAKKRIKYNNIKQKLLSYCIIKLLKYLKKNGIRSTLHKISTLIRRNK